MNQCIFEALLMKLSENNEENVKVNKFKAKIPKKSHVLIIL